MAAASTVPAPTISPVALIGGSSTPAQRDPEIP